MAALFDRVIATDASEKQIAKAEPHEHVEYRVAPAENSGIESEAIDLIMVAQALHWFDLLRFYEEARRALKPNGVLAASAYNLLHIEPAIDAVVIGTTTRWSVPSGRRSASLSKNSPIFPSLFARLSRRNSK